MASEASRSTGPADSYIGSLISLTSKSEIRYEGVLFNINTEEASIGLRNVRSFGTEGRRKDGAQVPASDKVYEYIVFRGSDIKDLQVKSSPPVQATTPIYSDPAIIQSHYAPPTAPSTLPGASSASAPSSSASSAPGSLSDFSIQTQSGVPRSDFQTSIPLYAPGGGLASWNGSTPITANGSGLSVPVYWQGYYGPSGALQAHQPSLLRPGQGLSMPTSVQLPSLQQPVQYPTVNLSLPAGVSNLSATQSMEFPPPLLQPIFSSTISTQSNVLPAQSSALGVDSSLNVITSKAPAQVVSAVSHNVNPSVSSALPNVLDKTTVSSLLPNQAKPTSSPSVPFNGLSESLSTVGGTSSSPVLVTPGQFLQPGCTVSQASQIAQKDVEVVRVSSLASAPPPPATAAAAAIVSTEAQEPLLPLPSPSNAKVNGVASHSSHTRYVNRDGRDRGRGNEFARPVANFTEDFDFEAMNEKFKKDEVWGHLGKNKARVDYGMDPQDENEVDIDMPKIDVKPLYKKDDFFDTLSCNALDHDSRNGRPRFSEQRRLDTETFGDFPRNWGYRGGRGSGRGGRSRGGYYGRGYGYVGRGRGHNMYRPI